MNINARLNISYYQTISSIDETKHIYLVQHQQTKKFCIKKELTIYNRAIYDYLQQNPIPYTPRIYALYEENNQLTVIEEYVSGNTLEEMLEQGYHFQTGEIKSIIIRLCSIISRLHSAVPQIIHRDIKPSNIIITPSGVLYLLDFNAAKFHQGTKEEDTMLLGTKGYAAPEQYGFGTSNIQTDIYAIGKLMNTLINGNFSNSIVSSHELSPIIEICTKLNASERYNSTDDIVKALSRSNTDTMTVSPQKEGQRNLPRWMRFLPPGYRSLQPFHIFLSTVGYAFIFWLSLTLEVEDAGILTLWIYRFFTLILFLSVIFCSCNYLNIQNIFPPCRTDNKLLKIAAVLLFDFIIVLGIIILMTIVITII